MMDVVLHLTDEQCEQIEILAQQRGYETIEAYIFSLIVQDAQKRLEEIAQIKQVQPKPAPRSKPQVEPPADSFEADFREALRNVMKKNSKPEDPWDKLNGE